MILKSTLIATVALFCGIVFGVTAILFLISLTTSSIMATDTNEEQMMELFASNGRRFALNLFSAINDKSPNTNLIFSPLSIQTCLGMAFAGAKEKTADEMQKGLLLVSNDRKVVGKSFNKILEQYQNNESLKIANKFYLKTGYHVTPEFNEIATKDFYSETENVDFSKNVPAAQAMNKWVEDKTNGKIKNLISSDSLNADTRMVLLNGIYFKAAWMNQFKKELTVKEDFWLNDSDKVQVDMMNTKAKFLFGDFPELDATAIEMPYRNGFSMFVVLPKTKTGLKILESKLKTIDLLDLKSRMVRSDVIVKLPKFKVNYEIKLKDTLTKMGMGTMFSKTANFDNLLTSPQPLEVSEVVHQAYIEVNEEGSEAAAATGFIARVNYSMRTEQCPKKHITINHPFIFYLKNERDMITFIGTIKHFDKVVKPQKGIQQLKAVMMRMRSAIISHRKPETFIADKPFSFVIMDDDENAIFIGNFVKK